MSNERLYSRFIQAFGYLRNTGVIHTQQDVADKMGIPKSSVSSAMKNTPKRFTEGFVTRFVNAYSDYISADWLLKGEGQMKKIDMRNKKLHIPSDKAVVAAGFVGTAINSVQEGECELRPAMTPFPWYDFTITVSGDSMFPTLMDGDTIACEWLSRDATLRSDKIYVLDSNDGAVVKRVRRHGSSLICSSDNPHFQNFEINDTDILRIARVVGVVREL